MGGDGVVVVRVVSTVVALWRKEVWLMDGVVVVVVGWKPTVRLEVEAWAGLMG